MFIGWGNIMMYHTIRMISGDLDAHHFDAIKNRFDRIQIVASKSLSTWLCNHLTTAKF